MNILRRVLLVTPERKVRHCRTICELVMLWSVWPKSSSRVDLSVFFMEVSLVIPSMIAAELFGILSVNGTSFCCVAAKAALFVFRIKSFGVNRAHGSGPRGCIKIPALLRHAPMPLL